MQRLLLFVLSIGLLMVACTKTEPPVGFNNPIFMVGFEADSLDTITAGLDNVYLFTRYDLTNGVFHSINSFSDVSCPGGDCPGSLTFEFTSNTALDSAFLGGFYAYAIPDSAMQDSTYNTIITIGDVLGQFPERTLTLFGSDTVVYPFNPQEILINLQNEPKKIALDAFGSNGLHCSSVRTILPGDPSAYPGVYITAIPNAAGYELTAMVDTSGSAVNDYHWNTGDSTANIFTDSLFFAQQIIVTVTDNEGKTASASISGLPYNPQVLVESAFMAFSATPTFTPQPSGAVAIQWVDGAGTIWRSDRKKQAPFASFEVLESGMYDPNENGDKVYKLKVKFNCLLYSEGGEAHEFSGEGVIAMARP